MLLLSKCFWCTLVLLALIGSSSSLSKCWNCPNGKDCKEQDCSKPGLHCMTIGTAEDLIWKTCASTSVLEQLFDGKPGQCRPVKGKRILWGNNELRKLVNKAEEDKNDEKTTTPVPGNGRMAATGRDVTIYDNRDYPVCACNDADLCNGKETPMNSDGKSSGAMAFKHSSCVLGAPLLWILSYHFIIF